MRMGMLPADRPENPPIRAEHARALKVDTCQRMLRRNSAMTFVEFTSA